MPERATLLEFRWADFRSRHRSIFCLFVQSCRLKRILRLPLIREIYHRLVHVHKVDSWNGFALPGELDGCRRDLVKLLRVDRLLGVLIVVEMGEVGLFLLVLHGDLGYLR